MNAHRACPHCAAEIARQRRWALLRKAQELLKSADYRSPVDWSFRSGNNSAVNMSADSGKCAFVKQENFWSGSVHLGGKPNFAKRFFSFLRGLGAGGRSGECRCNQCSYALSEDKAKMLSILKAAQAILARDTAFSGAHGASPSVVVGDAL